jgi:twitching motility protein PilT
MTELLERLLATPDLSDAHLEEDCVPWMRIAGGLSPMDAAATSRQTLLGFLAAYEEETGLRGSRLEVELAERGDLDFACTVGGMRVRGNLFRSNGGRLCLALRKIPEVPGGFSELGLPELLKSLLNRSKGLLLVTGPTGAGKSSTLAACVEHINRSAARHILTIEDPIEYIFTRKQSLIQQRQVGRDASGFSSALRAALREDPDVIMVGELRDLETIETALHAANTGHLVLGTLHTSGARQTIERIGMFFPEQSRQGALQTLSSVLIGVLSQNLVRCAQRSGRMLCYELMINTPPVRQAIKDGKPNQIFSAMELGRREGQVLLNQQLAERIAAGSITREDALYISYDPAGLDKESAYGRT